LRSRFAWQFTLARKSLSLTTLPGNGILLEPTGATLGLEQPAVCSVGGMSLSEAQSTSFLSLA
jgi:hypothetical protein